MAFSAPLWHFRRRYVVFGAVVAFSEPLWRFRSRCGIFGAVVAFTAALWHFRRRCGIFGAVVAFSAPLWRFSAILVPDINVIVYLLTYFTGLNDVGVESSLCHKWHQRSRRLLDDYLVNLRISTCLTAETNDVSAMLIYTDSSNLLASPILAHRSPD